MQNKVVMITGASSGIGKATAIRYAQAQCHLILIARNQARLKQLASQLIATYQVEVLVIAGDLSEAQFIEACVAQTMARFGRIDILVNSAGYGIFQSAIHNQYAHIQAMFQVNVFAMMYLAQLVALKMLDQQSGHIVFLASMAGKIPTPMTSLYSATKAATIAFADALRLELKPAHIQVTTVNPGPVKTAFFANGNSTMQAYYEKIEAIALDSDWLAQRIVANSFKTRHVKREINVPRLMHIAAVSYQLFPNLGDIITSNLFNFKGES